MCKSCVDAILQTTLIKEGTFNVDHARTNSSKDEHQMTTIKENTLIGLFEVYLCSGDIEDVHSHRRFLSISVERKGAVPPVPLRSAAKNALFISSSFGAAFGAFFDAFFGGSSS